MTPIGHRWYMHIFNLTMGKENIIFNQTCDNPFCCLIRGFCKFQYNLLYILLWNIANSWNTMSDNVIYYKDNKVLIWLIKEQMRSAVPLYKKN